MKKTISELEADFCREIARLPNPADQQETEKYFHLTDSYWRQAKTLIKETGFSDDAAEIAFFKSTKAVFTGRLEYYILLYRYLGHPNGDTADHEKLKSEELDRIQKFRDIHDAFVKYLAAGQTDWDDVYFLRKNLRRAHRPAAHVYDRVKDFWTNGDWIVTQLEGDKLFEAYLQDA